LTQEFTEYFMMRARWVFQDLTPELPAVGMATVARWWPGKYYLVSTIQLDESSVTPGSSKNFPSVEFVQPMLVGVGSTGFMVPYEQAPSSHELVSNGPITYKTKISVPFRNAVPAPNKFVMQVFRCNKTYFNWFKNPIGSFDNLIEVLRAATRLKGDRTGDVRFEELPLVEREYFNLSEARAGHKETVDLLAKGALLAGA
jgi:hypothetical protein